jgi:NitT/TauT family transport system substrate-binding protein
MFPVYAKAAGLDPASVRFVPAAPPALPQLLASGQVDGIGQFVVGRPLIEAAARGRKAVVLPYGDLVPDLYGNVVVTSKDLAARNPALVRRFTAALLKGGSATRSSTPASSARSSRSTSRPRTRVWRAPRSG